MKILSVVGARPQFIKHFVVAAALERAGAGEHVVVHTGQHYDHELSAVFFEELGLGPPQYELGVGSGTHAAQTAAMLTGVEDVLLRERPDVVLVYGDTNSTLAGALAAAKVSAPIAHVEAGLRSGRQDMPEEINRVVTDVLSSLLFAPTETAVRNLRREGIERGVHLVGDVMYDAVRLMSKTAERRSRIIDELELTPGEYSLLTVHRAANTDDPVRLRKILQAIGDLPDRVVFPLHPRTRLSLEASATPRPSNTAIIPPVGYLDMLALERHARRVFTDSGGVQKEAYFFGVPCVTLREETEWVETLRDGWNVLAGVDRDEIARAWSRPRPTGTPPPVFGGGDAGDRIAGFLARMDHARPV